MRLSKKKKAEETEFLWELVREKKKRKEDEEKKEHAEAPPPASSAAPAAAPAHDVPAGAVAPVLSPEPVDPAPGSAPVQHQEPPAGEHDDEVDHHSHASSESPLQDQCAQQHQQHQPQQPQQPQQQQQQPQQQHASASGLVLTYQPQQQQQQQQQQRFEALCASLNKTQRHQRQSVEYGTIEVVAKNAPVAVVTRGGLQKAAPTFGSLLDALEGLKENTGGMTVTLKSTGNWKMQFIEFIAKGSFGSAWRGNYALSAVFFYEPVVIKRVLKSRRSPGELAKEFAMAEYVTSSFAPNGIKNICLIIKLFPKY